MQLMCKDRGWSPTDEQGIFCSGCFFDYYVNTNLYAVAFCITNLRLSVSRKTIKKNNEYFFQD